MVKTQSSLTLRQAALIAANTLKGVRQLVRKLNSITLYLILTSYQKFLSRGCWGEYLDVISEIFVKSLLRGISGSRIWELTEGWMKIRWSGSFGPIPVAGVCRMPQLACWVYGLEFHRGSWIISLISVVCCQVEVSVSVCDHSTRGVLPSVMCLSVIVKSRKGEGPGPYGLLDQGKRGGS